MCPVRVIPKSECFMYRHLGCTPAEPAQATKVQYLVHVLHQVLHLLFVCRKAWAGSRGSMHLCSRGSAGVHGRRSEEQGQYECLPVWCSTWCNARQSQAMLASRRQYSCNTWAILASRRRRTRTRAHTHTVAGSSSTLSSTRGSRMIPSSNSKSCCMPCDLSVVNF